MRLPSVLRLALPLALPLTLLLPACADEPPPPPVAPTPPPPPPTASAPAPEPPPAVPASVAALGTGAMLFDDLGTHHRTVTASPEAAPYFDQGLRLVYGFNHDEAVRSFARSAQIDPSCAMCFWGAALAMGPNYNVPMLPDRAQAAWDALQRAVELAPKTTPVEQALISALTKRYKSAQPLDPPAMAPLNAAYADAMRDVAKRYPEDDDVQVLFAESLMDVNPWKLWSLDGQPAPGTEEIIAALEKVLTRAPGHPGANHYCIHAIEASPRPDRALPCAERLVGLMPGAGHMVHMPAHIYQRIGRYADASAANEKAAQVDLAYMKKTRPPGYYPMYLGHNYGFLSFSSSMEGRSADSLAAARNAAKAIPPAMVDMMPGMDFFISEPLLAMVRFGKWDDLLAEPRPEAKYKTMTAFWLHGHGMALAAKGKLADARKDLAELQKLADTAPADLTAGNNQAKDVFVLAAKILEARIATLDKQKNALDLWAEAVAKADKLAYSEPDDWFYSVRHYAGAAQLAAKKPKEAEATYREDLKRHPRNGWALFGLYKSLEAQHKGKEAKAAKADFDAAWAKADIKLTASAF
jgi:tetratricopeptide (TPR) repeat protein